MPKSEREFKVAVPDIGTGGVSRRTFLRGASMLAALGGLGAVAAACGGGSGGGGGGGADTLNFYNWTAYIDETSEPKSQQTIPLFESETGIKVNYSTYSSNDELLTKLRSGNSGFDLVVPSDYAVKKLIDADALDPLLPDTIPNLANLAPKYRDTPFDPGNQFSVIWMNGNTGIGYNTSKVTTPVTDSSIFGDPAYKGKMTILDEMRSTVAQAMFFLGIPLDTTSTAQLDEAFAQLEKWKSNGVAINSDYQDPLGKGDLVAAMAYSGDVYQQIDAGATELEYVIPTQGSDQYIDAMVIPKGAPNPENARRFINYVYEPEVSARLMEAVTYRNGNEKAYPLLPPEVRDNPVVFPPPDVEARLKFVPYLSDEQEEQWRVRWDKLVAS